jgi:hypothetical protein
MQFSQIKQETDGRGDVYDVAVIRNMKRLYKSLLTSGAVEGDVFHAIFGQFEVINGGEKVIWTSMSEQGYDPRWAHGELMDDLSMLKHWAS